MKSALSVQQHRRSLGEVYGEMDLARTLRGEIRVASTGGQPLLGRKVAYGSTNAADSIYFL